MSPDAHSDVMSSAVSRLPGQFTVALAPASRRTMSATPQLLQLGVQSVSFMRVSQSHGVQCEPRNSSARPSASTSSIVGCGSQPQVSTAEASHTGPPL